MSRTEIYNSKTNETSRPLLEGSKLAREIYDLELIHARVAELIDAHDKIEHDNWEQEPEVNARTAIFEALTAKGHLSRIAFEGDIDDINAKTLRRLLNGWSDGLPDWERKRRFYELAEEVTIQQTWQDIVSGVLPEDTIIFTISDYPEQANDELAHTIGYRSLNKKGMVRGTHFELNSAGHWVRVTEQISRSNSHDKSSNGLLKDIDPSVNSFVSSAEILSNQILASRPAFPNGVVNLQALLDQYSGPNVLYGETTDHHLLPSYAEIRQFSAEREEQAQKYIERLANFERGINVLYTNGIISYDEKLTELNRERSKIIDEICLLSPNYARDAMGQESAELFERASLAMAEGNHALGQLYLQDAIAAKDPRASAVCGGIGQQSETTREQAAGIYAGALESRSDWKWKKGQCVIKECPTRPDKTEVGPCDVCRDCQLLFDKGMKTSDIRSKYRQMPKPDSQQSAGFFELLTEGIAQDLKRYDRERRNDAQQKAA